MIAIDYLQLIRAEHSTNNRVREVSGSRARQLKGSGPQSWTVPSWPPPSSAVPWKRQE